MSWALEGLAPKEARSVNGRVLITGAEHWFREGPVQPDGYWICGVEGCGRQRYEHVQAQGQWMDVAHGFVAKRITRSRCRTCGYHRRHSRHVPWRWEQYQGGKECGGLVPPDAGLAGGGWNRLVSGRVWRQEVGWPDGLPVSWLGPAARFWFGPGWPGM